MLTEGATLELSDARRPSPLWGYVYLYIKIYRANSYFKLTMAKRTRAYSRPTRQAAELLGAQIRQARVERRWTVRELAERAGISTSTLLKIERGNPTVGLGVTFDVATLVGVPLFYEDRARLATETLHSRERAALLPQRVRRQDRDLNDEF